MFANFNKLIFVVRELGTLFPNPRTPDSGKSEICFYMVNLENSRLYCRRHHNTSKCSDLTRPPPAAAPAAAGAAPVQATVLWKAFF